MQSGPTRPCRRTTSSASSPRRRPPPESEVQDWKAGWPTRFGGTPSAATEQQHHWRQIPDVSPFRSCRVPLFARRFTFHAIEDTAIPNGDLKCVQPLSIESCGDRQLQAPAFTPALKPAISGQDTGCDYRGELGNDDITTNHPEGRRSPAVAWRQVRHGGVRAGALRHFDPGSN